MRYSQVAPLILALVLLAGSAHSQKKRARDHGITIGVLPPGPLNAITDVEGVSVGHVTLIEGENVRTGATAIIPHPGNVFEQKVPAAIYIGNGYGKLAGYSQVKELGNIETPIVLTNTLNIASGINGLIRYAIENGSPGLRSINAVVGETNDSFLNDIRGQHVTPGHVIEALEAAKRGPVIEGNVGAGTGTICFGWKGGIGTSSRQIPQNAGGYTVGVLVQTNFGGVLQIDGVPIGQELDNYYMRGAIESADGSCMIVVITDAPVDARNLERMAKRAIMGLARTGGIASNGSGDYVIALSVAEENFEPLGSTAGTETKTFLRNDEMSPLFLATIEATEEAIINSLFAAETMTGRQGHTIQELPVDQVLEIMRKYGRIDE